MSFDAREGPLSSREGCCCCLAFWQILVRRSTVQGLTQLVINKRGRGLAGGGVKGMGGRHSKDQCTTAGFGSVERATEVVRPGRGPIPPLCGGLVRRPVRRCSSLQFNTNIPKCTYVTCTWREQWRERSGNDFGRTDGRTDTTGHFTPQTGTSPSRVNSVKPRTGEKN